MPTLSANYDHDIVNGYNVWKQWGHGQHYTAYYSLGSGRAGIDVAASVKLEPLAILSASSFWLWCGVAVVSSVVAYSWSRCRNSESCKMKLN